MFTSEIVNEDKPSQSTHGLLILCFCCALLGSCVSSPEHGEWVNFADLDLTGYAENAGATIEVQAYDRDRNVWTTIVSTAASRTETNFGGETVYAWSITSFDFSANPRFGCYLGDRGYCDVPAGFASVKLKFREIGGSLTNLITYDEDGFVGCVVSRVFDGANLFVAGQECRSDESPVLTLKMLT